MIFSPRVVCHKSLGAILKTVNNIELVCTIACIVSLFHSLNDAINANPVIIKTTESTSNPKPSK